MAEKSTFDLAITFYGLCMFVPEGTTKMHVILPATGGTAHHGHSVAEHLVLLGYDNGYTDPTRTAPIGSAPRFHELTGSAPTLRNRASGGVTPDLPATVANVHAITKRAVKQAVLKDKPTAGAAARVSLHAGRHGTAGHGAIWNLNGNDVELAPWLEWKVGSLEGDTIDWEPGTITNEKGEVPPTFYPRDKIELYVFNIPADEMPNSLPPTPAPRPLPCDWCEAEHFRAYYELYDPPVPDEAPKFVRYGGPGLQTTKSLRQAMGISPFTCMVGGG